MLEENKPPETQPLHHKDQDQPPEEIDASHAPKDEESFVDYFSIDEEDKQNNDLLKYRYMENEGGETETKNQNL